MTLFRLKKKQKKRLIKGGLIFFICLLVGVVFLAEKKFSSLVVGGLGEQFSTSVYSYPLMVRAHQKVEQVPLSNDSFLQRLKRLNYRVVSVPPQNPGEVEVNSSELNLILREFACPFYSQEAIALTLSLTKDGWDIKDPNRHEVEEFALEPELVAELSGSQNIRREPATWQEIPVRLADAVVAVEDGGFYRHWGISPRSLLRATWNNLSGKKGLQGGSTITQQLAKNLFLSPQRTLRRKIIEVLFAFYLEIRMSKERILTLYLNHIYMGQDGLVSVAGVKAAADFYFGKPLSDLSLSECALLAGVIRSPYRYNPFRDYKNAKDRRDFVLQRMKFHEFITPTEFTQALREPLLLRNIPESNGAQGAADYFVAEVVRQLLPAYGEEGIYRLGLKIYTTMDPLLQKSAQEAVKKTQYQAALVALDPATGYVRALVGGKSFKKSQFNRATQANRQPGSAFKPFVFGAALEKEITPASFLMDKPRTLSDGKGGKWNPKNVKAVYRGKVTVREALANSLNSAALDLTQKIGPSAVVDFSHRIGILSPIEKSVAVGLGVSEVNLLELTGAYATFDNGGYRVLPQVVLSVVDADNNVLEIHAPEKTSVLDPALSFVMTSLLQSTVSDGTAKSLPLLGWSYPSAGKTGTTNDGRDAWFIGYTPELVVGTWVGDDTAKSIFISGASHALPIWANFMVESYRGLEPGLFEQPAGVIRLRIDPNTGALARSGCPTTLEEVFIKGTEPMMACPIHAGGVKGWFKKLFQRPMN